MRCVIQRVSSAAITIDAKIYSKIRKGLLILVGIEAEDSIEDVSWLSNKIVQMRIFGDDKGLMNLSINDVGGELMLVSQFTLFASTKKGNRPSFIKSAKPPHAIYIYELMIEKLNTLTKKTISTGIFGADMKVQLVNDGPVTIIIDSKQKE